MRFKVEELDVQFPYPRIYPEQYAYMLELKRSLDAKGHAMLEMPTGTGKTITLLSLITSYQRAHPEIGKLIYCTRTIPEMEKVLEELKSLEAYRDECFGRDRPNKPLALGLSSRRNLCVHPEVSQGTERDKVDQECRALTASWVRERAGVRTRESRTRDAAAAAEGAPMADIETLGDGGGGGGGNRGVPLCSFFEKLEREGTDAMLPVGVYTLEQIKELGRAKGWCPYFLARHVIAFANVVVYNYQYLLDPKISQLISKSMQRECVVVFDEAHNIDNICIEVMSMNFRVPTLEACSRNISRISSEITKLKASDASRLRDEYQRLVSGLASGGTLSPTDDVAANPVLPDEILHQAVPGNLRRADSFVSFMRRLVEHLKKRMQIGSVLQESPTAFLLRLAQEEELEAKPLKFVSDRLRSLLRTLEVTDMHEFSPLMLIADFASLVATFQKGFAIIIEPFDERTPTLHDPLFQFCCNDASIAIKPVFERFQSVVITSGTLSPIEMYPKILGFEPCAVHSFSMSYDKNIICPLVVTRGSDQSALSSKFDVRSEPATIRNYGKMLLDMAATVPDGMVVFFTSYSYMQEIVREWDGMGILKEILAHKLIFIETTDVLETTLALENFKRACDCGRGAVFLSVARGKVAEGVDFDRHYGRAVLLLGIPFQYTLSRVLRSRLEYLRDTCSINEADFLTFDAIRQAGQCAGRVIRGKSDYGLVVFADKRYNKADKREKLPQWIRQFMSERLLNLSVEGALHEARQFLREMAQPSETSQVSLSLQELERQSCYVAHASQAGITQHPMQVVEKDTLECADPAQAMDTT
ncbi:hypothetical protein AB1Y20_008443 [Prymnesium parvum]|uniref:DNA 5'-3' helicase n=1 Tax=Prymnesium parvum TaxID=97485 RepID=A0AB34IT53_PRYPA